MEKVFGKLARKANQRLKDLGSVDNLAIMATFPAARCHELTGKRKGELAVSVSVNYRITFESDHHPIPKKNGGGLDWKEISSTKILSIEDYY